MIPGHFLEPLVKSEDSVVQQTVKQRQKVDGGLTVEFDDSEYDQETGDLTFSGHVTARYGVSSVQASTLTVNSRTKKGTARGGVRLDDPEGHAKADSFEFDWVEKTGTLTGVVLQADNVHIEAATLRVVPGRWDLSKANLSLSRVGRAPVSFEADSATIFPGRRGVARRVFMKVYGTRIGPIARLSFVLRRRLKGIGHPSITNRKGLGVGVSWEAAFAAGEHGAISSFWDSFPKRAPGFGLQYSTSPLSPDSATQIAPRSDLLERFEDGWFNNVGVRSPNEERDNIGSDRMSYAVGSFWNQATTARPIDSEDVSKRLDFAAEFGGTRNGLSHYTSLRAQSLRESGNSSFVTRTTAQTTLLAPSLDIARGLDVHLRVDAFGSASENGLYGWGRVETGLFYQPNQHVSLGLGYALGSGIGKPDFTFDTLVADQMVMARADVMFGPFTFRYLNKYNVDTKQWFDREYEIALVAREFEPYIVYRQFPSETRLGIRFRIDNLRDRLTRRNQAR